LGDSGDSGVSSPGPPSSEASEQKHSGEEEEEEEDADEEDDRGSDNLSYMDRVVMEVVESETVYVRDLQQVVEVMRTFDYSVFVASAASKNKRNFFVSSFVFHTNNNRNHRHNNNHAKGWLGGWVLGRVFGRYGHPAGSEERDFAWRSHERTHINKHLDEI
jgi:hypothetical protein